MGVGYVPQEPIRSEGEGADVQGRQRRGDAGTRRNLSSRSATASLANNARGRWGEDVAARWYQQRGYQIVERNWRCRHGEVDIVAAGHGWLVFCEVKTRSSERFGPGSAAVDAAKQARIHRIARAWLGAQDQRWPHVRFDVASITGVQLEVIEDAF